VQNKLTITNAKEEDLPECAKLMAEEFRAQGKTMLIDQRTKRVVKDGNEFRHIKRKIEEAMDEAPRRLLLTGDSYGTIALFNISGGH